MNKLKNSRSRFFRILGSMTKLLFMMLAAIIALIVAILTFAYFNKMYWDSQVDELCAAEGGITVYEKVDLRLPEYANVEIHERRNTPLIPIIGSASQGYPIVRKIAVENQRKFGDINLTKTETQFIRLSDNKILSRSLRFGRGGGDLLTKGVLDSNYACFGASSLVIDQINLTFEWGME